MVGDFNGWDGRLHPMRSLGASGIWELFVPEVPEGSRYKYELRAADGELLLRADPFAFAAEMPPQTASVVTRSRHRWADKDWLRARATTDPLRRPMSVYEVHLGSWRRNPLEDDRPLSYVELADELATYVTDMGFTHVELLPVMAHPFTGSWGYQVTSYFAPTPRFGEPDDLRAFVDRMHEHGIGVLLDWVPAHFPRDEWALARFDGTALFEHEDPRRGAHPEWGTLIFNYGRNEVRNFLVASALYWLREYHADGLRVDAVASMLYLDYSRKAGEWVPNAFGGREDLDAVAFLKQLNDDRLRRRAGRHQRGRGVDGVAGRLAPDLRRRPRVRLQVEHGLDARHARLLRPGPALSPLPPPRADLRLIYAFIGELHPARCPTTRSSTARARCWQRCPATAGSSFANLRALYAYMWAHPGKKLLFMGGEIAQEQEWSHERSLDWHLLERRRARRHPVARARPQPRLPRAPGAVGLDFDAARVLVARAQRRGEQRARVRARLARTARTCSSASATSRRSRARATGSGCRAPAAGARRSTPTSAHYGGSGHREHGRAWRPSRAHGTTRPYSAAIDAARRSACSGSTPDSA